MSAHFGDYVNLFSVVGGIALTLLCYLHGLNYIALKTTGPIRDRARNYASAFYGVLYFGLVALPRYFISKQISLKNILLRRFFC